MISIVIPLYNKAHTIERTLSTVFSQNFPDWELIIVNDGSTDGGLERVKFLTASYDTKIIDQPNQGVSAARNRGVAEAKYDYIAFLDADDEWEPAYLEKMVEAINAYPECGLFCCAGKVRNASGSVGLRLALKYRDKITEINFFENPHVFLHTSAAVVKKSDFLKTGGFPIGMKRNEDFALFYSLALLTPVVYCGLPLSTYNGRVEGQATETKAIEVITDCIERYNFVFKHYLNTDRKNNLYTVFTKYELRHTLLMFLNDKEYEGVNSYLTGLDAGILKFFRPFELMLCCNQNLRFLAKFCLYLSKVKWRSHGYPRTGQLPVPSP